MNIVHVTQGSPEWHEHRSHYFNASDAPAMLGVSPYKTRDQLLREHATGIQAEASPAEQERFAAGHRFEALYRPLAEVAIGQELFPVVGVEGKLGASFDGLTLLGDIAYEHKMLNDELRALFARGASGSDLPLHYQAQMEQQRMVSGCERVLFAASSWSDDDTLREGHYCWYTGDPALRERIRHGWEQFAEDLKTYVVRETAPAAVAQPVEALPALLVTAEGRVTASNLPAFRDAADRFLASIKTELATDQDFADAELTVKFCKDGEERLELVKSQVLSQTASIDEVFRTIDHIAEQMRAKRLMLSKAVKERKEQIRAEIVMEAQKALDAHVSAANGRLAAHWIGRQEGRFAEAIKGRKTLDGLRDAVDTALASAKITVTAMAKQLEANRGFLKGQAHDWVFLFPDFATVGARPIEEFAALLDQRIALYRAEQQLHIQKVAAAAAEKMKTSVVDMRPPTLSIGDISRRLGINLTASFIAGLGYEATKTRSAMLYHERDWPRICNSIIEHVRKACAEHATVDATT